MFIQATNVVKNRLIGVLERQLLQHPDFKDVLVSNKMPAEKDWPSKAIIISNVSGSQRKLDLSDLKMSGIPARSVLARTVEGRSTAIEWVMNNFRVLDADVVAAGYYYTKILTVPTYNLPGTFQITPVLLQKDIFYPTLTTAPLSATPLNNKVRVYTTYQGVKRRSLVSPAQYIYDTNTNEIVLSEPLKTETLVVEYLVAGTVQSNIPFNKNTIDVSSLPGIVLAFGERIFEGDQQVIYVGNQTDPCIARYDVYGGQWALNVELTCYAQDPGMQERLLDYTSTWLWQQRVELENSNITITDIGLGGESTDLEVTVSKTPFFSASMSVDALVDWELMIPNLFSYNDISTFAEDDGTLTDEQAASEIESLVVPVILGDETTKYVLDTRHRLISPGFLAL